MAKRINPKISEEHRKKIQTTQLIKRLESFVNDEIKMSSAQVTAALGLLKKSLPDLSQVDANNIHDVSDTLADILREVDGSSAGLPTAKK